MNRRNALKDLLIASGGLITLPLWMQACRMTDKDTHLSSFSPSQQGILAAAADTIIPAGTATGTDSNGAPAAGAAPGALSTGTDKFLQKLFDDCYERSVQDNVKQQLDALDADAKTTYSTPFADCSRMQRQALLMKRSISTNKPEKDFFDLLKNETIRGFNTSQKVMEAYYHYKVAPGHYYGSVTLKA